jgi:ubiquinone/menaquinone biosynthesis C-methylase UbiE
MSVVTSAVRARHKPYLGLQMEGPLATWYARTTRDRRDHRAHAEAIARLLPNGGAVLEVAPGPGYLAIALASTYPGAYQIAGLDISRSMVRIARDNARRAGVTIDFRHGDVASMPFFQTASFDHVVCVAAFKNFPAPVAAFDEIQRVLRPGGQASIFDLRKDAPRAAIDQEIRGMHLGPASAWLMRWIFRLGLLRAAYTRAAVEAVVARSRFGQAEILDDGIGFEIRLRN